MDIAAVLVGAGAFIAALAGAITAVVGAVRGHENGTRIREVQKTLNGGGGGTTGLSVYASGFADGWRAARELTQQHPTHPPERPHPPAV